MMTFNLYIFVDLVRVNWFQNTHFSKKRKDKKCSSMKIQCRNIETSHFNKLENHCLFRSFWKTLNFYSYICFQFFMNTCLESSVDCLCDIAICKLCKNWNMHSTSWQSQKKHKIFDNTKAFFFWKDYEVDEKWEHVLFSCKI